MAMPNDIHISVPISHLSSPPPVLKSLTVASIISTPQSETHPRADLGALSEEVLQKQGEMNVAIGQLLKTRASMDSHQRRLVSHTQTVIKEAKALYVAMIPYAEAKCAATIWEVETTCADHTHTLQWSLDESMQDLECKAIEKEGWDCLSFLEAHGVALQACPTEVQGVLVYPLQLLMGNVSLATLLATTTILATLIGRPTPETSPPTVVETPTTPTGTKQ